MAIQITSLSELSAAKVDSMFTTLSQLMQEKHPEVELTRGVFHDLVLYFSSVLNAAMQENVDRVLQSNSLLSISANPALADATLVDQVLSNYNLTRDSGTPASGTATVILSFPETTVLGAATNLAASGVTFNPTGTFQFLPPGSTAVNATDRVMTAVGDGTYAATITVLATTIGTAGNVTRGTKLVPNYLPSNIAVIYATADFINGKNASSNADYIAKLAPALAAKTVGGRQSYVAAITGQPAFASIPHLSILGCGDPEQKRDQHGLFPISGGGKVDIYLHSSPYAQTVDYMMTATYVGPGTSGTVWRLTFNRDKAPGFYEVIRVAKPADITSSGYQVLTDVRGTDFSTLDFVPSVKYQHESIYTRYQTAVIQFEDTSTATIGLTPNQSTAVYSVSVSSMPLVAEVQDFLSSRDIRSRVADVLVRAAVPCFTKISFQVLKAANDVDPDIAAIQAAVSAEVGNTGFTGQLHASRLAAVTQALLSGRQALGPIDMFGKIRRPNGDLGFVRDTSVLQIPDDPEHLVTGRTTTFLTRPEDVAVSVVAAGFTN